MEYTEPERHEMIRGGTDVEVLEKLGWVPCWRPLVNNRV